MAKPGSTDRALRGVIRAALGSVAACRVGLWGVFGVQRVL